MNRYFLPKSGWEFFDVSKAYGLGIIIHTLSGNASVTDAGGFYLIESKKELDFRKIEEISKYFDDTEIKTALITIQRSTKSEMKPSVKKVKENVVNILTNEENLFELIKSHEKLSSPTTIGTDKQTLYQTMDLAATKGIRNEILLKKNYSEGSNINISMEDFSFSLLGHLNFTIKRFSDFGMIFVAPTPLKTEIGNVRQIYMNLKDAIKGAHRAGWFPSVTQIAINLVLEELTVEKSGKFAPKFGSLIYSVMMKTGNQWKPSTGGISSLDFLYHIANSENGINILNKWKNIFRFTAFKKGYEDLPTSLAEFIANPDLSNYERYLNLHLRNEIDKNRTNKFGNYERENLQEVMKNVRI